MSERMKELGEVRAILARGVSSETFDALCAFYPEGEMPDEVVDYLLGHLQRWPNQVRRRVPDGWMRQVEDGNVCRAVRLCNALWIEGQRGSMQRFNRWSRCEDVEHIRELVIDSRGQGYRLPERLLYAEHFTRLESFYARGVELWARSATDGLDEAPLLQGVKQLVLMEVNDRSGVARELFLRAPVLEHVRLTDLHGGDGVEMLLGLFERDEVPARIALKGVQSRYVLSPDWVKMASACGGLSRVREVELVGVMSAPEVMGAFLGEMASLERLDRGYSFETDEGVNAWCEGLRHAPLRSCRVEVADISLASVERLLAMPWRLEELALSSVRAIGELAEVVSDSPAMQTLKRLDLSSNRLVDESCEALASSPWLDALEHLSLRDNHIGDKGVEALLAASFAHNLIELDLEGNAIDLEAQRALWRMPKLTGIRGIDLKSSVLDDRFWEDLGRASCVEELVHLSFEQVRWQHTHGFERLLERQEGEREFRKLRTISIEGGSLPVAALDVLSRWPAMARIRKLQLRALYEDEEGAGEEEWSSALQRLLSSSLLAQVEVLDLSENAFGASSVMVEALMEGLKGWRGDRLRWLSLKECGLSRKDLQRLGALPCLTGVRVLVLHGNAYDAGVVDRLRGRFPGASIEHEPPYDDRVFLERGMLIEPEPQEFGWMRSYAWEEWEI